MGFLTVRRGARRFFFTDVRPEDKFFITERRVLLVRDRANIADTPAENRPRAVVAWEPFTVGTVLAASRTTSARVVVTVPVSGYVWFKPLSTYTIEKARISDSFFRVKGSSRILATAPATPRDLFTASTRPVLTIKDSASISSSLARQKPPYTLVADKVNTLDRITTSRTTSPLFYTLFAYRPRIRFLRLSVADRANVAVSAAVQRVPVVAFTAVVGISDVNTRVVKAPSITTTDRATVSDVVPTASVSYVSMYGLQKLTVFAVELMRVIDSASAVLTKSARVVSAKDTVSVLDKFVLPIRTLLIADRVVVADKKV